MSVLQPISYGLVHQIGPGTGARGFGSYKADNTELIRPYQQEASSPIGRGYPISVVSGAPTVYDPRAGIKEDPVVMLLKQLLGQKPVVEKAPDAGFMKNEQVYVGGDSGIGGGGGGDVVVGRTLGEAPRDMEYPVINVEREIQDLARFQNIDDITPEQRGMLGTIVTRLTEIINHGGAAVAAGAAYARNSGIPMTPTLLIETAFRQIEESFRDYLPTGTANTVIDWSRQVIDLITNMERARENMVRLGERALSDYVYAPVQSSANRGLGILINQARTQLDNYGEVAPLTIAEIVDRITNNVQAVQAVTMQAIILTVIAVLNPGALMRAQGRLRANPTRRMIHNVGAF